MNQTNKELIEKLDSILPLSKLDKCNVLLIDDEHVNLTCFKAAFRKKANIFTASNKKEALEIVNNNKIDVIFCDYRMPVDNGADILKEIVSIFPKIRRSIVTGFADNKIIKEFREKSNTFDLIIKPYTQNDILERINHQCY